MEINNNLKNKILDSFPTQEGLDVLLIMSEHWDGYKRENAVRRLGMLGNPVAIPNLIVRANDWVKQVRSAARESLEKLLTNENAEAFVLSLPELYHLQNCARDNHNELISTVINFLIKPENNLCIKLAINNHDPYIARIAVNLCIENSLIDKQKLVSDSLSHPDVIVRDMAADILRTFTGEVLELFLQKAINDPFMPIRREAFQIYLRVLPAQGLDLAHNFLFDRHASIREIAVIRLLKNNINVEQILAKTLFSTNQSALKIRCAILGLADIGSKQLTPTITSFSRNLLPSIRKASVQALAKLLGEEVKPYLIEGLNDPSPGVAKESARLLCKLNINLSVEELLNVVENINYSHTLIVCITGAKKINKWDRLIFLLNLAKLYIPIDISKAEILDHELIKWDMNFNRSSSQPSNIQIERLGHTYNQCKNLFTGRRLDMLDFTMKGCGINI